MAYCAITNMPFDGHGHGILRHNYYAFRRSWPWPIISCYAGGVSRARKIIAQTCVSRRPWSPPAPVAAMHNLASTYKSSTACSYTACIVMVASISSPSPKQVYVVIAYIVMTSVSSSSPPWVIVMAYVVMTASVSSESPCPTRVIVMAYVAMACTVMELWPPRSRHPCVGHLARIAGKLSRSQLLPVPAHTPTTERCQTVGDAKPSGMPTSRRRAGLCLPHALIARHQPVKC